MRSKKRIHSKLPFLLGFALCNNIIYLFNYNHLYINISNFISLFILLYILLFDRKSIGKVLAKIDKSFYLYVLVTILSILPATFYFINEKHLLKSYFNGIPSLILLFIEYFCIIYFSEEKMKILKGIAFGGIINIFLSFVSYVFFVNDSYFTLYKLFPNPSFQICGSYSLLNSISEFSNSFKIYIYRAQGLFLETSHYLTFVCGSILITIFFIKKSISKIVFILSILYLGILSISGNFALVIITIFLYLFIIFTRSNNKKISRKVILVFPFVIAIIISGAFYIFTNDEMMNKIEYTISSLNFNDSDNENRSRTIIEGLELIEKYPFGIGYNNTSNVLKYNYPNETQSYIFSTLVLNELELGLIGNIIYIIFLIKFPLFICKNGKKKEDIIIAVSMIGVSLCQISNGISYWNIQYIIGIYALGNVFYNDLKNNNELKKEMF